MLATRFVHILMFASLLAASACKKDKAAGDPPNAAPGQPAAAPAVEVSASKMPAEFQSWDVASRAKAWQGAWVTEQSLGFPTALEVKGTQLTTWDGKAEKHLEFELESPCSAKLIEKQNGGESSTISHFTIKNGALVAGLGDAGSRKGKAAIACVSNQIFTLDDAGTCLAWSSDFGRWKSEPGKCGFAQKDGKDVFTATANGSESTLVIDGDAMMSQQLATSSAKSYPDFAAAKAARDAAKH